MNFIKIINMNHKYSQLFRIYTNLLFFLRILLSISALKKHPDFQILNKWLKSGKLKLHPLFPCLFLKEYKIIQMMVNNKCYDLLI